VQVEGIYRAMGTVFEVDATMLDKLPRGAVEILRYVSKPAAASTGNGESAGDSEGPLRWFRASSDIKVPMVPTFGSVAAEESGTILCGTHNLYPGERVQMREREGLLLCLTGRLERDGPISPDGESWFRSVLALGDRVRSTGLGMPVYRYYSERDPFASEVQDGE
jgi:hypothetical protein